MINGSNIKETNKNKEFKSQNYSTPPNKGTVTKFITITPTAKNAKQNNLPLNQPASSVLSSSAGQTSSAALQASIIQTPTSQDVKNREFAINASTAASSSSVSSNISVNKNLMSAVVSQYAESDPIIKSTTIGGSLALTLGMNPTIVSYNLVNKPILYKDNQLVSTSKETQEISSLVASQLAVTTNIVSSGSSISLGLNALNNSISIGNSTNQGQMNIRQSVASNSIYMATSQSVVASNHLTLVSNHGTILRGNTRHILACNVANRNQCLITAAVPMRAIRIQAPSSQSNRITTATAINSGVNINQILLEQTGNLVSPDKQLKIATQFSKVDATRSVANPRSFNAVYIQNRPFIAQTIRLSNPTRLPVCPVEIRQTSNAEEMGKSFSRESIDSRISGQSVVNFDNKILVSIGQNVFNYDRKTIGDLISSNNADVKSWISDAKLTDVKPLLLQTNSETKAVQFENNGSEEVQLTSQALFSDQLIGRIINQASSGEGAMIVVSQNMGQQFTALQNKGMVVSGLKLPAYIDLRQGSTNADNSRPKAVQTKTNRPSAFNPSSCTGGRSKDPNARSQMNEKDSAELERVMDILKHYKQQISCHDQVTAAHFLQPCKRKRSKPGESVVGTLTTTNCNASENLPLPSVTNGNSLDSNMYNLKSGQYNFNQTKTYNNQNTTVSYNANSIMASLNSSLLGTSLSGSILGSNLNRGLLGTSLNGSLLGSNLNGGIFGGSLNGELLSTNLNTNLLGSTSLNKELLSARLNNGLLETTTVSLNGEVTKAGSRSQGERSEVNRSIVSPRLLAFRPNLAKITNNTDESNDKRFDSLCESKFEMKENLPSNVHISDLVINHNNNNNDDTMMKNDDRITANESEDDDNDDENDETIGQCVCKEQGEDCVKEFIKKAFNLESDDEVKILIIKSKEMNSDCNEYKEIFDGHHPFIKITTEKIICLLEEIIGAHGYHSIHESGYHSNHAAESCASKTCLSLFGIFFSKDFNLTLDGDVKALIEKYDRSSIVGSNLSDNPLIASLKYSFKSYSNFVISKLCAAKEQGTNSLSELTYSKQETITDKNCFILAINNQSNPVQYLTIPNFSLLVDENKVHVVTTTSNKKSQLLSRNENSPDVHATKLEIRDIVTPGKMVIAQVESCQKDGVTMDMKVDSGNGSVAMDMIVDCGVSISRDIKIKDGLSTIEDNKNALHIRSSKSFDACDKSVTLQMNKSIDACDKSVALPTNKSFEGCKENVTLPTNKTIDVSNKNVTFPRNKVVTRASRNVFKTIREKRKKYRLRLCGDTTALLHG